MVGPSARPHLREEDECPICHNALPPKGPDGSEVAREAHVSSCIETHFANSKPTMPGLHASSAVSAAVMASVASPTQAGEARVTSSSRDVPRPPQIAAPSSSISPQRRRTVGMVVYNATEKDCVGQDGEGDAECVICFEEFSVGDEMGRLECLCKFHRVGLPSSRFLRRFTSLANNILRARYAFDNGGIKKVPEPVQSINNKKSNDGV